MDHKLNTKIGVLGGGQIGKMLIESYSPMNLHYTVLEKSTDCPCGYVCSSIIEGSLYDSEAINALAKQSDVLTYEIEHVNIDALKEVGKQIEVIPAPSVLEIIQDKGFQKDYYTRIGVPTLGYKLSTAADLAENINTLEADSFVLKHRRGGYDGKGVQLLNKKSFKALHQNDDALLKSEHGYVIEEKVDYAKEIAVIVCVDRAGNIKSYEPVEMVFDPKANLLDYLMSPSSLDSSLITKAKEISIKAVKEFNSPGVFAVELFVTADFKIYVNEIAPRPHNSGHHSIESCYTSQYEQLNRILLDLPLGNTDLIKPAVLDNIVGPEDVQGKYKVDGLENALKLKGVYIHLYGKTDTKPYRKLGHITVLGNDIEDCHHKMMEVRKHLRITALN